MKFLCEQCKAKYQIADEKAVGKTVRMKCRKCGHLIEVRAAVTETSVSSASPRERLDAPLDAPRPPNRPPPPRARAAATSATAGGGASPLHRQLPERSPGALEGAFKSAVHNDNVSASLQRRAPPIEEEISAPLDMSDLSTSDEWYVAINGVPVGPIRIAEVRRKAALGAVTEDSLAWQEGLDEWRPLRTFPELAASVREAMSRLSRPPPSNDVRSSLPPPPSRAPARSSSINSPRALPPRSLPASASIAPRSNVVPFMSRLATAEKLDSALGLAPQERTSPVPGTSLASPNPEISSLGPEAFANTSAALATAPVAAALAPARVPVFTVPPELKKSPPWIPLTMLSAAAAFGVTAAYMFFSRPSEGPPAPVIWPGPGASAVTAPSASIAVATPTATTDPREPSAIPPPTVGRGTSTAKIAPPGASSAGRSIDLHSLNAPTVTPTDEPGGEAPKVPSGPALTEAQVQQVVSMHRAAVGRICWERNPSNKPAVNVSVLLTVGPDGTAQNVSATGDESSVAKCIENDVRGWHFPATGSSQKMSIPFKFVRQ